MLPDERTFFLWLHAQSGLGLLLWAGVLLATLIGIVWLLRQEQRQFAARGKARAWGWVRLLALPMLGITAAAIVMVTRIVSGPEGLAAFYLTLLILGPLLWLGLHALAGRLQSPRLRWGESAQLALTGGAMLLLPLMAVNLAQGPIAAGVHQMQARALAHTPAARLPHQVLPPQSWHMGTAGTLTTQALRAPAGIQIERVEGRVGAHWSDITTSTYAQVCRHDSDLYLAWDATTPPPELRVFWRDADGVSRQAEYRIDPASLNGLPPRAFTVSWRESGFGFAVPLSRHGVRPIWQSADGKKFDRGMGTLQPGDSFIHTCVMPDYTRRDWQREGPVAGVALHFYPPLPARAWQVEFLRDAGP